LILISTEHGPPPNTGLFVNADNISQFIRK
jgi:hypothetical protein